jgi:prepilin-type processing-associated H-X9-DG protein
VFSHAAPRSYHNGGVNVALADGSVDYVSDSVELLLWRTMGTRDNDIPDNVPTN